MAPPSHPTPTPLYSSKPIDALVPSLTISLYLAWFWIMSTLAGAFALLTTNILPGGVRLSIPRAIFQAVSASTLTGYPSALGIDDFLPMGQWTLFALTLIGTFCALAMGGLAIKRVSKLETTDFSIVLTSFILTLMSTALGLLLIPAAQIPRGPLMTVAALGNSSLWLAPAPNSSWVPLHLVLLPLSLVGSLGVVVILDMLTWWKNKNHQLTSFTKVSVIGIACAFVISSLLFFLVTDTEPGTLGWAKSNVLGASVLTGYAVPIEFATHWPRPGVLFGTLLTLLGGGAGGTTSGISIFLASIVIFGIIRTLRGTPINPKTLAVALLHILALITCVIATYTLLLSTEPQLQADRILLLSATSATNSGLAHDPVSVVGQGLFILSLNMTLGRALPLITFWLYSYITLKDKP